MNILYLGNNAKYSTEKYVEYALKQAGHRVVLKRAKMITFSNTIKTIKSIRADVVLFSKPSASCFVPLLKWCKANKVLTVCWQWDLYFGYRPRRPVQFASDLLFTTDGGHQDHWDKLYPQHKVLRQGLHSLDHRRFDLPKRYDVAFVGMVENTHTGRRRLIGALRRKYGKRFKLVTHGLRGHRLNRFLSEVKVVVGDSYPAPNYWSNRIYEMIGRGAFLLYPFTEGLDADFTEGIHYVGFPRGDFVSLFEKVDFYLRRLELREAIIQAGFDHVGRHHLYSHRVAILQSEMAAALSLNLAPLPSI